MGVLTWHSLFTRGRSATSPLATQVGERHDRNNQHSRANEQINKDILCNTCQKNLFTFGVSEGKKYRPIYQNIEFAIAKYRYHYQPSKSVRLQYFCYYQPAPWKRTNATMLWSCSQYFVTELPCVWSSHPVGHKTFKNVTNYFFFLKKKGVNYFSFFSTNRTQTGINNASIRGLFSAVNFVSQ